MTCFNSIFSLWCYPLSFISWPAVMTLLYTIIAWTIPVLLAITIHEAAHAWIANRLGDDTAKRLGRLSFNPLHHIDLIGTILVPVVVAVLSHFQFIFGWAKPVPINYRRLKTPRRDEALVAAAGPVVNGLMAVIWLLICKGILLIGWQNTSIGAYLFLLAQVGILINLIVAFINLIPIPPLDGSRIMASLMPPQVAAVYMKIEPYGFVILFVLLVANVLSNLIEPFMQWSIHLMQSFLN
jgi:Zn-dependent protease